MPDHCSQLSATILFSFSFGFSKDAILFVSSNQNHIGPITEELLRDHSLRDKTVFHHFSKLNSVSHTQRPGSFESALSLKHISNLFFFFLNQTTFLSARIFSWQTFPNLHSTLLPSKETTCPSCFQSSCIFHELRTLTVPLWTWIWALAQRFLLKYSSMLCILQESSLGNFGKMLSKPCLS